MSERRAKEATPAPTLDAVCDALDQIAPTRFAQEWDNVGLLAGNHTQPIATALLCIDMMPDVVDEAIHRGVDLIVSYHPPIFRGIKRLSYPGKTMESGVARALAHHIAIYSPHTALDVARGGPNDVLAAICGLEVSEPIERNAAGKEPFKLVTFVPAETAETVAQAMTNAGAGAFGDYDQCTFRSTGIGTFRGNENSKPARGKPLELERVNEVRIEVLCNEADLPRIVKALLTAHPYEEVAYDIFPRHSISEHGIGRVGTLKRPTKAGSLAKKLKRRTKSPCASLVGDPDAPVSRIIIGVGNSGNMPFGLGLRAGDLVVTGEMRHHDALTVRRLGAHAVVLGHWSSERPTLRSYAKRITEATGIKCRLSEVDQEPFGAIA